MESKLRLRKLTPTKTKFQRLHSKTGNAMMASVSPKSRDDHDAGISDEAIENNGDD